MIRSEFRAFLCLVVLIICYLVAQRWLDHRRAVLESKVLVTVPLSDASPETVNRPVYKPRGQTRTSTPNQKRASRQNMTVDRTPSAMPILRACTPFDPNTVLLDSLVTWGLPHRVANNLVKYRNKGGSFRSVDDVSRIYGMDSLALNWLEACMQFPSLQQFSRPMASKLCINSATAEDWQTLYGIGPVLSKRIVQFREALGGFTEIVQVADTYGLPPETFDNIQDRLKITQSHTLMQINSMTEAELASHPYVSGREARAIANYVRHHGPLGNSDDLYGIHVLAREDIEKLDAYLSFTIDGLASGDE